MIAAIEKIIRKFFWVPFVLAFVGYYIMDSGAAEMNIFAAIYASCTLYFINPVVEKSNTLIVIAKLLALIVTADVLLNALESVFGSLSKWFIRRHKDATAVYTDTKLGEQLLSKTEHSYQGTRKLHDKAENTRDHIIMFEDDTVNLGFYENHKQFFKDKNCRVFIALNRMNSTLLKNCDDSNVHFFCINELVARDYWKNNSLYEEVNGSKATYRLAILGFGTVGKEIFKQGYLNNIFRLDQKIEYHIWGGDSLDRQFAKELTMENSDSVVLHEGTYREALDELSGMDRIIVTEGNLIEITETLLRRNGSYQIHCYNNAGVNLSDFYLSDKLLTFGNLGDILTCENIKTESLFRQAKLLNYDYILRRDKRPADSLNADYEKEMEDEWIALNGFTKGSNIAHADYYATEKRNQEAGVEEIIRWELEHIRWCRYHYVNGWKYAPGKKNPDAKTHGDLVPFEKLSLEVQKVDGIYNSEIRKLLDELV